jgi:hypothetical protein
MPNLAIVKPQPGDEITSVWGTSVADGMNGLQAGTATTPTGSGELSGALTVTFPRAYASPPVVVATAANPHWYVSASTTATAATFTSKRLGQSTGAGVSFFWMALGVPA